jgi:DNA processing protein
LVVVRGKQKSDARALGDEDVFAVLTGEQFYPPRLRDIPAAPPRLFARGRAEVLASHGLLAVVGSRGASNEGLAVARELSAQIATAGAGIVSGLAEGIDAAAHEAALASGAETIAVLGGGLDEIWPPRNRPLAEQVVAAGGALISEQPPGTPTLTRYLVARNRLISGMAAAVLIVECELGSGTLHTVRFAAEQGRPIFVPPLSQKDESEGMRLLRERFGARSFDDELLAEVLTAPIPPGDLTQSQLRLDIE